MAVCGTQRHSRMASASNVLRGFVLIACWAATRTLHVLNLGMDTGTATGKLLLTVIGAIGQFEREMMLERQREGIAKARANGKYKGRKPTAQAQAAEVQRQWREGVGPTEIARRLGISRASIYRIIGAKLSEVPLQPVLESRERDLRQHGCQPPLPRLRV
jgi:DNA invertase Pin-like site-specific DNA recombinase